jgi:RES domain-containing protein
MFLYRIANKKYLRDLSGLGAKQFGGRWNSIGTPMVYTSSSISLATLEILCHTSIQLIPNNFGVITIEIPETIEVNALTINELPLNWDIYPSPTNLAMLGNDWIQSNSSLLLKVPSVIIKNEFNFLINPLHKDFNQLNIIAEADFDLDKRISGNL